jgi:hypothetical protein
MIQESTGPRTTRRAILPTIHDVADRDGPALTEIEGVYVHRLSEPGPPRHFVTENGPDVDFAAHPGTDPVYWHSSTCCVNPPECS